MTYEIKLPQFEGPFDLLLFFIERDELDIYDIPIARVTDDFLTYLNSMESLDLDIASEFILVAATLMRIKAKLLLPRKELDEQGNEIDPRLELVEKLLEYKKYKAMLADFQKLEEIRQQRTIRGNTEEELMQIAGEYATEAEMSTLTLYKLLNVFQKVMERLDERERAVHQIVQYPFTIEEKKDELLIRMKEKSRFEFSDVFETCRSRMEAIFTFLALLELIQQKLLTIRVGSGQNNFWVMPGKEITPAETETII